MRSRSTYGTGAYLTVIQVPVEDERWVGTVECSYGMPQVSTGLCDHVVSYMMAMGANVEDYILKYQTAE